MAAGLPRLIVLSEVADLRVRDIMTPDPISVKRKTAVIEVARVMAENNIGSVVVVDDAGTPIGIITEEDLVKRVLAKARDPRTTLAEEVMSSPLIYVDPSWTVKDAVDLMARKGIGHLPVLERGKLVGIVAEYDIVRLAPEFIEALYIKRGSLGGYRTS